ncbi:hypothetical protein [Sphingobium nicotianae]|uniref:Uncharacterized protein n=1 Tax=Sphingobium nicotianae TaxID=2782607 RepID=A0A9X1ISD0_9SPHN|nr:hypothetical protein [Sphingobium nicotianae]MBT2188323.1 hypothetical protein [Sphingobium nicotianae]
MLLYAVSLDRLTLTDSMIAYGDPADPLLPVGELARLLDLDLTVLPSDRRITGTLGEERRAVTLDFAAPITRVGGRDIVLAARDIGFAPTDVFIRAKALEAILPVRFVIDGEALTIEVQALETLPIQAKQERIGRLQGLSRGPQEVEKPLRIATPYLPFTPPTWDAVVETGTDTRRDGAMLRRYDLRFAGDLLYSNVQGYVGSDDRGKATTARLLFERRSATGALPLGATRISAGDVFTPALAMGPRSVGGRGFSFSTAAPDQASQFNTIDLRGELPIGYDVELYVNDILRSGQRTPVEGRYEFLDVPLVRGVNVIRIVTYGPHGERSETVRVVNAGGGLLRPGQTTIDMALVQQERALIEPDRLRLPDSGVGGIGTPRLVVGIAHGLTDMISLIGGAGLYSSTRDDERDVATVGLRAGLGRFAVQTDAAADQKGGRALAAGIAGDMFGISTFLRHAEYRGGFLDETIIGTDFARPPVRKTMLTADMTLPFFGRQSLPLSFRLLRDGFPDGGVAWTGTARASTSVAHTLVSTGLDYQSDARPKVPTLQRLTGNLALSRLVNYNWQLRAIADYDLLPDRRLRSIGVSVDRSLSDRLAMRLGYGQSFGDGGSGAFQGGAVLRLPFAEISLTGDYETRNRDWRVGLRISFGALFDPGRRRYVMTPPGVAAGANAAIHAFIDNDANGRFSPGDQPAPNVTVEGGLKGMVTGADGHALVTGLGIAPSTRLRLDIKDVDSLYLSAPPSLVEFAPRAGQVVDIPYPLVPAGEVYARLFLRRGDGETGLSALRIRLVRDGQAPIMVSTEFDGSAVFSQLPPGTYRLEIDPEQAGRLHMRLKAPVTLAVAADSTQDVTAEVIFEAETP